MSQVLIAAADHTIALPCGIFSAETDDLIFYRQSMLLSIPLALLAGTLAVVLPEAYKKAKMYSGLN
jgi:hypothetical protein